MSSIASYVLNRTPRWPLVLVISVVISLSVERPANAAPDEAAKVLWIDGEATMSGRPQRGGPRVKTELQPLDVVERGYRVSVGTGDNIWLYYPDLERVYMVNGPCDWVASSDRGPALDACGSGARLKAIDVAGLPRLGQGQVPWQESDPLELDSSRPIAWEPREISVTASRPTLRWRDLEGGHRYELIIWRLDPRGELHVVERWRSLSALSHTLSRPLTPGQDYLWAVRRSHVDERHSAWRTSWFHVLSLAESDEVSRVGLLLAKRQVEEPGSSVALEVLRGLVFEHFSLTDDARRVWDGVRAQHQQYESLALHLQRLELRVLSRPRAHLKATFPFGLGAKTLSRPDDSP